MHVAGQPIQQRTRQPFRTQDLGPLLEGQAAGYQGGCRQLLYWRLLNIRPWLTLALQYLLCGVSPTCDLSVFEEKKADI